MLEKSHEALTDRSGGSNSFTRPWLEGVVALANLVSDAVIPVAGEGRPAIDAAIAVLTAHDLTVSADLASRIVPVEQGADGIASPEGGADWIAGFEDALCFLAGTVDLSNASPSPFSVAVFGIPLTRNEWDARADVDEVRRMIFDGTGLSVSCFWPSSSTMADLGAVGRSGILLATPYGLKAAGIIAARTGARVVEVGLPLGFDACVKFMQVVGGVVGRGPRSAEFASREIARIVPRFEWVVPHSLLNRRIGIVGDVVFVDAVREFLAEVGCDVCYQAFTGGGDYVSRLPAVVDPDRDENVTLVVGNNDATMACLASDTGFLEVSFPTVQSHVIYPKPYLGFNGSAAMLQDMVNRMNVFEILGSWKDTINNEEDQKRYKSHGFDPQEQQQV